MSEIPPPAPPPMPPSVPGSPSPEEKNWGVIAHLSALSGYLVPFGWIIGPLVVYLIKKDLMPFAAGEAKSALNFQITMAIAGLICIPLMFICIGFVLIVVVALLDLIFIIVAAVKASDGKPYKYPIAIQFVK